MPGSEENISQLSNSPSLFSGSIENTEIQENLEKDDDSQVPSSTAEFTLLPLGSRRVEEKVGLLGSLLHPEQDENYYLAGGNSPPLPEREEVPPLLRQSSSLGEIFLMNSFSYPLIFASSWIYKLWIFQILIIFSNRIKGWKYLRFG